MTALAKLKAITGEQGILTHDADMAPYLASWGESFRGRAMAVAFPQNTGQLSTLMGICYQENIPMVPQGGNTGLTGGGIPSASGGEVVINLSRMNRIRTIDTLNFTLTAEAGCVLQQVQKTAEEKERLFPLSMASQGSCQIGGVLSTNAGGTAVLRYGNTRSMTLGLEVVLPDGRIWNGLRSLRKDNTGYDLKHLFIGAEGTLGIITAGVFTLFPLPKSKETVLVGIHDLSFALDLLATLRLETEDNVTAFEVIASTAAQITVKHLPQAQNPLKEYYPYFLLIELSSGRKDAHLRNLLEEILFRYIESGHIGNAVFAENLQHAATFWMLRESISEAAKREGKDIHFDISLPVSSVPDFMQKTDALIMQAIPEALLVSFGHIGDGNIHYNICLPHGLSSDMLCTHTRTLKDLVYRQLSLYGGSISAEHGIGISRREDLKSYKSETELALMHSLKNTFDPKGLMNPKKVL